MSIRLVTPPSVEPVSLTEAKSHLRLEESNDDAFVTTLIVGARQYIEKVCWRGLLVQVYERTQASFRGADSREEMPDYVPGTPQPIAVQGARFKPYIELERGHLAVTPAIVVSYLDPSGVLQTLSSSAYIVGNQDNDKENGQLWLNSAAGYSWPSVLNQFNAVRIRYSVGYATAADVPEPLKQSIKLLISQMYEYRTPEVTGTIVAKIGFTIDALTQPYRFARL